MAIKYTVCPHDCPDVCAWEVEVDDGGKLTKIKGDPSHPVTQGTICEKTKFYGSRVYGEDRVLYPHRRIGKKGSGEFQRISWDEALTEIAERWQALIQKHGAECILPYSYAGNMGIVNKLGMDRRFFHRMGASRLERTICSAAGVKGYSLVYGEARGINPVESSKAKLILLWGVNALATNMHQALLADQARKNGARVICIDVHGNATANWADKFYHILPGSDGALALGIAHILFRDGLVNNAWAEKHVQGLKEFAKHVKAYPPEKVADLTGLTIEELESLAHLYGETQASYIRIGNGLQHHDNGGMAVWAIASLPALTGAWAEPGGGAIRSNAGWFPLNSKLVERPDLQPSPTRLINMMQLGRALTELEPPVHSVYIYSTNPMVVAPEQELVRQGLEREDLFTVVHDQIWTDTARMADIVLPATTHLEHPDLYASYWQCTLQWAEPVLARQGESKPNIEVFSELAKSMGFTESCFKDTAEDVAAQALDLPYWHEQGITLDRVRKERFIELKVPALPYAQGNFPTPSGKAEIYSEKAVDMGFGPLPIHTPLVEGPETASKKYPLTLLAGPNRQFLNSSFANLPSLRAKAGRPELEIHSDDAAKRGIQTGDLIEVFNDRGSCRLHALVKDSVLPGVVATTGLFWTKDYVDGRGINSLTPSRLSDMGNGATFFSNLVEIRRFITVDS
ncbi:MAG: molybdopterin-containing oxidoreductase family protein [Desulfitobacterium sp.]